MKLARPLAVLDLETTGPSITMDRIVDISIVTRIPNGGLERWSSLVNPGAPIPPERVEGPQPDFLRWVLRSDFSAEVKGIVTAALEGKFPQKEVSRDA